MAKEAVFTLKLEAALRDQFMAAAAAADRPASQVVRELMRDFVERQRDARAHDAWFRDEIEQALREAADRKVKRVPHEDVKEKWRLRRAELAKRAGGKAA